MLDRSFSAAVVLAAAAALAACAKHPPSTSTTTTRSAPMPMQHRMGAPRDDCPAVVRNTSVRSANTDDGVEMTFTTTDGDVGDLRRRVTAMAEHMNARAEQFADAGAGMAMGMMPPARAQVTEIENGARLRLTPLDPSQRDDLRIRIEHHTRMMTNTGDCPWM